MLTQTTTENEIQRLARIFRDTLADITRRIFEATDVERARMFSVARRIFDRLADLDDEAEEWSKQNIRGLYRGTQKEIESQLKGLGLTGDSAKAAREYVAINNDAIMALLQDPQTGFLSSIWEATGEIRNRVKSIQQQVIALNGQRKLIDETIARVGILEGRNLNAVKEALMRELLSGKAAADLVWRPALTVMGPRNLFANLANMPYVSFPSATGARTMRVDRYVELVARTKTSQVTDVARRNKYLQHGQELVVFSRNRSKWKDACDLYIGRVFGLTESAAREAGVAHVGQLPSGGCPLHPNCTHMIHVYFDGLLSKEMQEAAFTKPPKWALGQSWSAVQAEYKKRGGEVYAAQQNPMFKYAQISGGFQRKYGKKK